MKPNPKISTIKIALGRSGTVTTRIGRGKSRSLANGYLSRVRKTRQLIATLEGDEETVKSTILANLEVDRQLGFHVLGLACEVVKDIKLKIELIELLGRLGRYAAFTYDVSMTLWHIAFDTDSPEILNAVDRAYRSYTVSPHDPPSLSGVDCGSEPNGS